VNEIEEQVVEQVIEEGHSVEEVGSDSGVISEEPNYSVNQGKPRCI
jgi:hypothetical protein